MNKKKEILKLQKKIETLEKDLNTAWADLRDTNNIVQTMFAQSGMKVIITPGDSKGCDINRFLTFHYMNREDKWGRITVDFEYLHYFSWVENKINIIKNTSTEIIFTIVTKDGKDNWYFKGAKYFKIDKIWNVFTILPDYEEQGKGALEKAVDAIKTCTIQLNNNKGDIILDNGK